MTLTNALKAEVEKLQSIQQSLEVILQRTD
jgi:hypothetical protein